MPPALPHVLRAAGMTTPDQPANTERQQTDESLRAEREKADLAIVESLEDFEAVADSIVTLARQRADAVLAAARAKVDDSHGDQTPWPLLRARAKADQVLEHERAAADEVVREERSEQVAQLATERSVTDKDLVHERVRADDALATRDEFLAIVSHDLRNLLNTVLGFAELIAKEASRDGHNAKVISDAQRIQRSGARMNRLIGDLVDVASIHAGTLAVARREQSAAPVVHEAVEMFQAQAAARGINLVTTLVPPPTVAAFDPARLLQVLVNLLGNALKFTPRDGTVEVRVEAEGRELRFSVSDTGPGIPADKLEAIFDRYLQVRSGDRRGVGLGLYISRCIVQGHGGRIWASNGPNGGATVSFALPLKA